MGTVLVWASVGGDGEIVGAGFTTIVFCPSTKPALSK